MDSNCWRKQLKLEETALHLQCMEWLNVVADGCYKTPYLSASAGKTERSQASSMADVRSVQIVETHRVSPPEGSVPLTAIPLCLLDVPWLFSHVMQRLFFYKASHTTDDFRTAIFPSLKSSLSLTLQHFFPWAANLVCPPPPQKPHVLYSEKDFLAVALAESSGWDFDALISDSPQEAKNFHHFLPVLPNATVLPDGTRVVPLMAVQFTVFPGQGYSLGICFRHVAADGIALRHFIKSWTTICQTGDPNSIQSSLPFLDRTVIQTPEAEVRNQLGVMLVSGLPICPDPEPIGELIDDKVRATYVLTKAQIERLKNWISLLAKQEEGIEPLYISTFVVSSSLVWVCLMKSLEIVEEIPSESDELSYFGYVADCRKHLENQIPPTYFGNCLSMWIASLKLSNLIGENGLLAAAKSIGKTVREVKENPLKGPEKWMADGAKIGSSRRRLAVAGASRLNAYDTDFGWGRPIKTEVVHIDLSGPISLAASRNDDGGVEIGVALNRQHMDHYHAIWEQRLSLFS